MDRANDRPGAWRNTLNLLLGLLPLGSFSPWLPPTCNSIEGAEGDARSMKYHKALLHGLDGVVERYFLVS